MRNGRSNLLAATATALALLVAFAPALAQTPPGPVSPFYSWSGAVPGKPGVLLRTDALDGDRALAGANRSLRLLYTSTDGIDGKTSITVSGALFLPKGEPPKDGWPLLAWAHWSVGVADVCAPSWAGPRKLGSDYLNHWLDRGYAVVATDYQGLGAGGRHPYGATRPEAYGVLDSIRAVQAGKFGISTKVVLIGQSQGAGATIAAAGYAPAYAPELDILGAVATGVPYFSPEALTALQKQRPRDVADPTLAYTVLALFLAGEADPAFVIDDHLTPVGREAAQVAESQCIGVFTQWLTSKALTYNQLFSGDLTPTLDKVYRLVGYQTLKFARPLFVGTGGRDRDAPTAAQQAMVKDACAAGTVVEARLYPEFDHGGAIMGSLPDSTPFIHKLFNGEPIKGNCP